MNVDSETSLDTLKNMQVMIKNFLRIEDGSLMKAVDMRQYGYDTGDLVSNVTVQELCVVHPKLTRLDLSQCKLVTDVGLWAIAKHCLLLDNLILTGCEKVTNVGIRSMSLRNSQLLTLDLCDCLLIDDICLTIIAGGAWKLQYLYLRNCARISDNGVVRIAQGLGGSLKVLDMTGCTGVGEFGDRALREIGSNCKQLQQLLMADAKRVEDSGLIAVSTGCSSLEVLALGGCENITKKGFYSLCKTGNPLRSLRIGGCRRIIDADLELLSHCSMQSSLTSIDLYRFEKLTDRGVGIVCKALGQRLTSLHLAGNRELTDYSARIIGHFCPQLRALDLQSCGHLSDEWVHTIARSISCLTSLKLDGNPRVTISALISHVGKELDFVMMATQWLGYQSRPMVESLIRAKEVFVLQTQQALLIQKALRRKFAMRIYWERYRSHLVTNVLPLFQARVRGVQQRVRYMMMLWHRLRRRMAVRIQACYRRHVAVCIWRRQAKKRRLEQLRLQRTCIIQRIYRGMVGRRIADMMRIGYANSRLALTKRRAIEETRAIVISRVYHGFKARRLAAGLIEERRVHIAMLKLRDQSARLIQRIIHGKIGRIRAVHRRIEIATAELRWVSARSIQRVFRGLQGRKRYKAFKALRELMRRHHAAMVIQRMYRGYCGRLLAAVASALRKLRAKHQYFALEMQRFVRGCIGRQHFKVHRELVMRRRLQISCARTIQRVFRGHKGREARVIERELQSLDSKAKPLTLHLKHLEESAKAMSRQVRLLEENEARMNESLFSIERELAQCSFTTGKYSDSSRINGTPQRFLTKFLAVRLKDLLEHETEVHKVKYTELQKRRAELRDLEGEIQMTMRELIPLTTGLIADIRRKRTMGLRQKVWRQRLATTKIQALWRRALVRTALYDPYKLFWVSKLDRELSDKHYYYNLKTFQILWKPPLAYWYFGDRYIALPSWAIDMR